jgi:hypothetical protein
MAQQGNTKATGARPQETPKENKRPIYSKKYWTGSGHVEIAVFEKAVGNGQNSFTRHAVLLKKTYKDGEEYKVSVSTPFTAEAPEYTQAAPTQTDDGLRTVDCIGIIDHFSWGGGAGDPICIGAYVSTEFANHVLIKDASKIKGVPDQR